MEVKPIRLAAFGQNVQIGQYYSDKEKRIMWAYPRLYDGSNALQSTGNLQELDKKRLSCLNICRQIYINLNTFYRI